MQSEYDSQAFSIQELEAKLENEVLQNGEFKRQLDEKAEICRHLEVHSPSATNNNYVIPLHYTCLHVLKVKELTYVYIIVYILSGNVIHVCTVKPD